jgi:hypothetical protein
MLCSLFFQAEFYLFSAADKVVVILLVSDIGVCVMAAGHMFQINWYKTNCLYLSHKNYSNYHYITPKNGCFHIA